MATLNAAMQADDKDVNEESVRLSALDAAGILDSAPEPAYDAITRLAAEHFRADTTAIAFGDETRIWVKSHWGESIRERPRHASIFNMILKRRSTVEIADLNACPEFRGTCVPGKKFQFTFVAAAPVRVAGGNIVGSLNVFSTHPRPPLTPEQVNALESMADMVGHLIELRRLRKAMTRQQMQQPRTDPAQVSSGDWPCGTDLRRAWSDASLFCTTSPRWSLQRAGLPALKP